MHGSDRCTIYVFKDEVVFFSRKVCMKVFYNLPSFRNLDTVVALIVIYNVRKKTSHTLNEEEVILK